MKLISQPLDFFGQNIYNAVTVRAGEDGKAVRAARYDGFPQTAIGWPVTPEVLYWAPKFMQERYKKPFMITENGMASHDWVGVDGKVHDQARVDFMARYLGAYKRAAEDGVDLAGYFAWSVMDISSGYTDIPRDSDLFIQTTIHRSGSGRIPHISTKILSKQTERICNSGG